jgi:drug/metabolite transporter (DMT)-like permease
MLVWIFFAILDSILTGVASVLQKKTLFKEHALEFVTITALFGAFITLPAFFLFDRSSLTQHVMTLIFLQALLVAAATLLFAKSLRHLPISIAGPILVFSPVLSALFAFLFLNEQLTALQIAGVLVVVAGAWLLEADWKGWGKAPLSHLFKGEHTKYMIGAMLLYTFSVLLERRIVAPVGMGGAGVAPALFLAAEQLIIAAIYLPMLFFFHDGYAGIRHGIKNAGPAILLVALLTVGYRLAGSTALSYAEGKLALFTAIKRTSVLFAVALGGGLFHEEHLAWRIGACGVMIAGAVMILI